MNTILKTMLTSAAAAILVTSAATAVADGSRDIRGYAPAMRPAPAAYGWNQGHAAHPLAGLNEIRARQSEQLARIERGFHRGSITRWEYRRLMTEQQDISAMERAFVSDGFLSPHERSELHRRLDMAAHHIFVEAHDAQRRYW